MELKSFWYSISVFFFFWFSQHIGFWSSKSMFKTSLLLPFYDGELLLEHSSINFSESKLLPWKYNSLKHFDPSHYSMKDWEFSLELPVVSGVFGVVTPCCVSSSSSSLDDESRSAGRNLDSKIFWIIRSSSS